MKYSPLKTIKAHIMICFLVLIFLAVSIFYRISLNYTEETVLENSIDYAGRLINQVNSDIDYYIGYMRNISDMVTKSFDIQEFLQGEPDSDQKRNQDRILTQFGTIIETREDIANIAVIAEDGRYIINTGEDRLNPYAGLEETDWFLEAMEQGRDVLSSSHVQYIIEDNYKWVVTLCQPLYKEGRGETAGIFFIDLNYKLLRDLCENNSLGTDSYIFIMDDRGNIIYHPKQQLLFRDLTTEKTQEVIECTDNYFITGAGEDRTLYTISQSEQTGWYVVGVTSFASLMPKQLETKTVYFLWAGGLILSGLLLALVLVSAVMKPIKVLRLSMREVEKGDFEKARIKEIPQNEIGALSNSFNIMIDRIHRLMEENIQEQEQKRRSELKALRSQINPHFLYNTLDSIIWMAEGGKNREVVLMTSSLAKLLRQSISNDEEMIPLWKEIEYVRSYLTIQKMRYKDKLEFAIQVDPQIREERIVNLVLQPIVENAIYHGIKNKEGNGLIQITGALEEGDIVLRVIDNGAGMDEETLAHIFDRSREHEDNKKNGVGIYNVHLRIKLYCGEGYGLEFASKEGEGTVVTIKLARYENPETEENGGL